MAPTPWDDFCSLAYSLLYLAVGELSWKSKNDVSKGSEPGQAISYLNEMAAEK